MSLRVWLPLDGTLENKGLSQVTVTNSGAVANASGKIGSCYSYTTTQSSYLEITGLPFTELTNCSISFWIKVDSMSTNGWLMFTGQSTSYYVMATQKGTGTFYHGNAGSNLKIYKDGVLNSTPGATGEWHHYVVTGANLSTWTKFYLDRYSAAWNFAGEVNDIRIYDHCLSLKEVKEISQGLVLHYKLDDPYLEPTVNLLGSKSNYFASGWSSYGFGGHGVKSIADEAPAVSGQVCRVTSNGTGTNQQIEMATSFTGPILEKNEKITASVYVKGEGESIGKMGHLHIYNTNGTNTQSINIKSFTFTADWQRVEGTFTWGYDTASRASYNIYVVGHINNGESFLFSNVQAEEKDHATPFTVGSRNDVKVYDCSGYGNDGTVTGSITADSDTARYDSSTKFPDSACAIGIGNLTTLIPTGVFTFNIWFKKDTGEWSSKSWETILGGPSGFELEGKLSGTQNAYVHPYSWGGGSTTTPNSYSIAYELDTWNMLTMVRNETGTKFYLNGEWKVNGSSRGAFPSGDYFIGAWKTALQQNFRGHFSDARIYATALSDEDIKELYNTSVCIDNKYNTHAYEFIEDDSKKFTKTGLVKFNIEERDKETGIYKIVNPNLLQGTIRDNIKYTRLSGGSTEFGPQFTPTVQLETNKYYTFSALVRGKANMNVYTLNTGGNVAFPYINKADISETDFKLFSVTFRVTGNRTINKIYPCTKYGEANTEVGDWFEFQTNSVKLEEGQIATPWIPASTDKVYRTYDGILTSNQLIEK